VYLSITDLGFHNLAVSKQKGPDYTDGLNEYIRGQKRVYLRIGLTRRYKILLMVVMVSGFK